MSARHMIEQGHPVRLTATDRDILQILSEDSRRTISDIASVVGVSRTTVKDRIDLMRESGVIRKFTVELRDDAFADGDGAGVSAFLRVSTTTPNCGALWSRIKAVPGIVAAWSVAGDTDMIVQLHARNTTELDRARETIAACELVERLSTEPVLRRWGVG
jgi:Lrp/AsnC family leucine-responsive transcriptional regulator